MKKYFLIALLLIFILVFFFFFKTKKEDFVTKGKIQLTQNQKKLKNELLKISYDKKLRGTIESRAIKKIAFS